MPFFATGLQFSEAGNSLEGMETTGYNASLGESSLMAGTILVALTKNH